MGAQEQAQQWPFAAREPELEAFSDAWADRRCQGLILWGPAGSGKSRLAEEYLSLAVRDGWRGGRATATASTIPLETISHLIPAGIDLSDPVKAFATAAAALAGPQKRKWALRIDDLHLLDATSAVLLGQLLDAGAARLIGTVRTGEPVPDAVEALCNRPSIRRIDLSNFDQQQLEDVLRRALGGEIERRTLAELHAVSHGNILFVRELVLGALADGTLVSNGEIWSLTTDRPAGTPLLTELISTRLSSASPDARPVLELLALCTPVSLADAEGFGSLDTLVQLEESGLIQLTVDRRRVFVRLAHPLYAELLRSGIPVERRRAILLQQSRQVESAGSLRRDDALHVAGWRLAATGAADPALLVQAASLARYAHDYQQVLALLEALPPEQGDDVAVQLLHAEALVELARWREADELLVRADAGARDEGEKLAVTLARTMNMLWANARTAEALALNDAAKERISGSTGQRILQINEAVMRTVSGEPDRGLAVLDRTLEDDVWQAPDHNVWLTAALMRAVGLTAVGRTGEAVVCAQRARQCHLDVNEHALVPHPASQLIGLCFALTESGDLRQARATGELAFSELLAARAPLPRIWTAFFLGRVELMAGHIPEARRWFAESVSLAQPHQQTRSLRLALSALAASAALLGNTDAAEKFNEEALAHQAIGFLAGEDRLGTAWVLAARGRLEEARAVLTEAAHTARSTGHVVAETLLLTDVARLGGAGDVVARLGELARLCDGAFTRVRASLARALAENDPDRLLAVAEELDLLGADLLAAEAATAAAVALQASDRQREATAASQRAGIWAARCQGVRTPLLGSVRAIGRLTAREREVAALAAKGAPSKEIAAFLHLSVRTVDNHIQRAYTKLGVSTRTQLAKALRSAD